MEEVTDKLFTPESIMEEAETEKKEKDYDEFMYLKHVLAPYRANQEEKNETRFIYPDEAKLICLQLLKKGITPKKIFKETGVKVGNIRKWEQDYYICEEGKLVRNLVIRSGSKHLPTEKKEPTKQKFPAAKIIKEQEKDQMEMTYIYANGDKVHLVGAAKKIIDAVNKIKSST